MTALTRSRYNDASALTVLVVWYGQCSTGSTPKRVIRKGTQPYRFPFLAVSCFRILLSSTLLSWFTSPSLLCFPRHVSRDHGQIYTASPSDRSYILARAFVRACFSSYKLDCRLARHSQFHGRHSCPFNLFLLAPVCRQLPFSFPTTVVTSYKNSPSSLSAYAREGRYVLSLLTWLFYWLRC